ncbi:hypothetical protein ABIE27_000588 [Paenibacillus sp. 4624]|jgi:hypothetical protein
MDKYAGLLYNYKRRMTCDVTWMFFRLNADSNKTKQRICTCDGEVLTEGCLSVIIHEDKRAY